MSPPIVADFRAYKGMTAYNMSKLGMTMVLASDCKVSEARL